MAHAAQNPASMILPSALSTRCAAAIAALRFVYVPARDRKTGSRTFQTLAATISCPLAVG